VFHRPKYPCFVGASFIIPRPQGMTPRAGLVPQDYFKLKLIDF
jgi:hypothetical protein